MYKRSIDGWAKHWDFIVLDTICLQLAFLLAYYCRFHSFSVYSVRSAYRTSGLVLMFLSVAVAIILNTMHNVLRREVLEEVRHTIIQCGAVFASIVILLFTSKDSDHVSRIVMYMTVGLYFVLGFSTRMIYKRILLSRMKNVKKKEMLLVGDIEGVRKALQAFNNHPEIDFSVKGVVVLGNSSADIAVGQLIDGVPVVSTVEHAGEYIRNEWVDEVYIAVTDIVLMPKTLISQCNEMAVTIHQQMLSNETLVGRQCVEKIAKQPVLTTSINIPRPRQLLVKRVFDIFAGLLMSLLAGMVLLISTPIIKRHSPGPVLLRHERIGLNGRKFKMFTIRTMYMDAEKRLDEWNKEHRNEKLTIKTDPRFIGNENGKTGIGYFLRHWSLDELPKGFNVLMGSMSLVGTRAPSVPEWEGYEYRHRARLACKPGITGLWQASGKSRTMSFEEATALDTEYIVNWSLGMDLKILFKTPGIENRQI